MQWTVIPTDGFSPSGGTCCSAGSVAKCGTAGPSTAFERWRVLSSLRMTNLDAVDCHPDRRLQPKWRDLLLATRHAWCVATKACHPWRGYGRVARPTLDLRKVPAETL
jgi:hypothetical protein